MNNTVYGDVYGKIAAVENAPADIAVINHDEAELQEQLEEGLNDLKFKLVREEQQRQKELEELIEKGKQAEDKKKKQAKKKKWKKIRAMSLIQLDENGHIEKLCKKYGLPKKWFDRVATTESSYGLHTPSNSYNAWGWGIYGDKVTKIDDNWYDASKYWIQEFMNAYGPNPSIDDMLRYCPGGAYNKYYSKADQNRVANKVKAWEKKEKEKKEKEKKKKEKEKKKKEKAKTKKKSKTDVKKTEETESE